MTLRISGRKWPCLLSILAMWIAGVGASQGEENWSRFRGPNGNGVAAGLSFPAAWTDEDLAWKISIPGKGHSSPIGWERQIFVTSAIEADGNQQIVLSAVDAISGAVNWDRRFDTKAQRLHAANSYASSTPAADAQGVYLAWTSPESLWLVALAHNGDERWRRDLGPVKYQHGFGNSLMVVDDLVIIANDNGGDSCIAALDVSSGELRWRRARSSGTDSYATPAVYAAADGSRHLIVHSTSEGMAGLSLDKGEVLWQLADAFPVRCVSSPIVADGLVIGGSGEGGNGKSFSAVKPPSAASKEPTVAYEVKKSIPQVPTAVAADGMLFIWSDRGVVSCHDLATGKQHWTERIGGNFFSSPVIAGDKVYGVAADGQAVVLAASKQYKLLGRASLGEASHATPAIHQGRMYLRTESSLACMAPEDALNDD